MPIIVMNISCGIDEDSSSAVEKALKRLRLPHSEILEAKIYKSSLDARKRESIHFVKSVLVRLKSPEREISLARLKDVRYFEEPELKLDISDKKRPGRVVIAGFGPAGMFCGLLLAENGYRPVVLERGDRLENRVKAVNRFWSGGELDENTNVQFGEGGAGTFSDGKLTTRIGDPLTGYVLKRLYEFGAPEDILTSSKPHIGTDRLRLVVMSIRNRIEELGGEIRFLSRLDGFRANGQSVLSALSCGEEISSSAVVLAIGHSARDTFGMLLDSGVIIIPKPFSVGARIEHKQEAVDYSLYGSLAGKRELPKGEYQLSHRRRDGRAAYTFCMCPGGSVVAASSQQGGIVTNGMSEYARDKENANSALVVSVGPADFGTKPLDGVEFALSIERAAYSLTNSYHAPMMTVGGLFADTKAISVAPSYLPGAVPCDFRGIFPGFVTDMMREGIMKFSREMSCFKDMGAALTAPETRTSSPVRIPRNEELLAMGFDNLYPCGEGAGYAGGIVSAAVDGLRVAGKIMESFGPSD